MSITRRITLQLLSTGIIAPKAAFAFSAIGAESSIRLEKQKGDPSMRYEEITVDNDEISRIRDGNKATFLKRLPDFNLLILKEAEKWIGLTRRNAKDKIAELLDIFNLPFDTNGKPVPFCASGISYIAALTYARADPLNGNNVRSGTLSQYLGDVEHHHFGPSPSVLDMYHLAEGKRRWVPKPDFQKLLADGGKRIPQPGWLVVFDFGGGYDHVGLLEKVVERNIHTIEFNTVANGAVGEERNGGAIARKIRRVEQVKGFINTAKQA